MSLLQERPVRSRPAEAPHAARPRLRPRLLWRPVFFFLSSRVLVLFAFFVAASAKPGLSLRTATSAWDGGYYFSIAKHGYPTSVPEHGASVLAFFPGFPLAIRGVKNINALGLDAYWASMIVVFVCGLVATCLVWLLTRELAGVDAADRATALFVFAPGSFVLSMAYSEALFVLFAIGTCWLLIRRQWILAGLLGAAACAVRPDGLALVFAAACAAYVAIKQRREWLALVAAPMAACGFFAVQGYVWAHTGDPFAFFEAERRGWHQHFNSKGTERLDDVRSFIHTIMHGGPANWNAFVGLVGIVVFVAAFAALLRWRPPLELIGFTLALGFIAFTSARVGFRPRLMMVAFPLSIALGVKLRRGRWYIPVLSGSVLLLLILSVVTVSSYYVTP